MSASVPEAGGSSMASEGAKDAPSSATLEQSTDTPVISEAGPSTTTNKGLFIDLSKPRENPTLTEQDMLDAALPDDVDLAALFGEDSGLGGSDTDFDFEQLFKDIDETAEVCRPMYMGVEEVDPEPENEPVQDKAGASSSGVEAGAPPQAPQDTQDAPAQNPKETYRKMTRQEKMLYFKDRASFHMDKEFSAYGIFDEEIPCLPFGLSQKQKDTFMGKYASWFKPQQHQTPVLNDLLKVNWKHRLVARQQRKGKKVTVMKDESTIISWWWDNTRKAFGVKRESGFIDYFGTIASIMGSLPEFELRKLARLQLHNPVNHDRANMALRVLIKAVQENFKGYDLVQGVRKVKKGVMHPGTGQDLEYVVYPLPNSLKEVNVQTHQPIGSLSDLTGWRYEGKGHFAVLEFVNGKEVMLFEPMDLTAYHLEDLKIIAKMQIRTTPEYEFFGKHFHAIIERSIEKADPVTGYVLRSPPVKKD